MENLCEFAQSYTEKIPPKQNSNLGNLITEIKPWLLCHSFSDKKQLQGEIQLGDHDCSEKNNLSDT